MAQDHNTAKMAVSALMEGYLAHHVAMIGGAAPDHGVELGYQIACCSLLVGLHDLPDFTEECLHILPGWFDEQFTSVLAYLLSQKIKAILDMRNAGFVWGEFQSAFVQKLLHQRFDFLCQEFLRTTCNNEVG